MQFFHPCSVLGTAKGRVVLYEDSVFRAEMTRMMVVTLLLLDVVVKNRDIVLNDARTSAMCFMAPTTMTENK